MGRLMAWSIAHVARMSGVTSRTLRHYDEIGLLAPAYVGVNGHRYYEEEQLLRLQQILVLRELGVGLAEIAEAIDSEPSTVAALRRHHVRLLAERDRLGVLADTVARTIAELEGGGDIVAPKINRPENLFAGFDASQYEDEARERWPEQYEQSKQVQAGFTPEQMETWQREMTAHMVRMGELKVAGAAPDDPVVLDEVDWHYRSVSRFWQPDACAYPKLGDMYVKDARFRDNHEKITEGLAEFQRDAMVAYARARLS
ncbi:MerR family transcriptional regulator [Actinoallomurus purpureus]|uniref:MerR family transcriptional regulator n=1 Tax=Actinoallomurus purpureus TaxID=478114 RepID=UPI0020920A37|nr:MerR family transcriptional regulator [Actinoallomurus purpureus]MCO6007232.1 MerR family transcriptional regulator [Actinoallomurus purpureus]